MSITAHWLMIYSSLFVIKFYLHLLPLSCYLINELLNNKVYDNECTRGACLIMHGLIEHEQANCCIREACIIITKHKYSM